VGFAIAIAALGCALYGGTLRAPFVFDDYPNIVKNPYIQRLDANVDADLADWVAVARKSPSSRPVANLSFAANHYFGGNRVVGYHVVNIAIHIVNGVLVYALASTLLLEVGAGSRRARWAAAFAAALFVSHPVQIQSVTYIVQRMNSLAAMFQLAALLLFVRGRSAARPAPRWRCWAAGFACWLFALGSKQTAITLPAAVFLYEWYFHRRLDRAWLARQAGWLVGAFGLGAALLLWKLELLNLAGYAERDFTLAERLLTQMRVVVFYASLIVLPLPSRLNLSHAFPTSHSLLDPATTLASGIAIAAALGFAVWIARRQPLVSFAILWFFVHLLVESTILPLEMVFEHRLYLPMFGASLLGGLALSWISERVAPTCVVPIALAILVALGVGCRVRNATWSDPATLWSDVVAKNPADHRARFNLGVALSGLGRHAEALEHHAESIRLHPDNAKAHNGMGVALAGLGRYAEAVRHFADSLRLDPTDAEARSNIALALSRLSEARDAPPR